MNIKIVIMLLLLLASPALGFSVPRCDLTTTGGNVTLGGNLSDINRNATQCLNATYYNFTVNSSQTVTNVSFTYDPNYAIAYQLLNVSSGTIVQNTTVNYFNTTLVGNKTYQIKRINSNGGTTYIVGAVGVLVTIGYGLWNRKKMK